MWFNQWLALNIRLTSCLVLPEIKFSSGSTFLQITAPFSPRVITRQSICCSSLRESWRHSRIWSVTDASSGMSVKDNGNHILRVFPCGIFKDEDFWFQIMMMITIISAFVLHLFLQVQSTVAYIITLLWIVTILTLQLRWFSNGQVHALSALKDCNIPHNLQIPDAVWSMNQIDISILHRHTNILAVAGWNSRHWWSNDYMYESCSFR